MAPASTRHLPAAVQWQDPWPCEAWTRGVDHGGHVHTPPFEAARWCPGYPTAGIMIPGRYQLRTTPTVDAVQWTGGNRQTVIGFLRADVGVYGPGTNAGFILDLFRQGAVEPGEWIVRHSEGRFEIASAADMADVFIPRGA